MKTLTKRMMSFITSITVICTMMSFMPAMRNFDVDAASGTVDISKLNCTDSTYEFIKKLEGCSYQCFWDVKQWTIGFGNKCPYSHTKNGTKTGQKGGHTITEATARSLFNKKIPAYVKTLKSNCKGLSMNQNQFDALLSATYNHGNVNTCPLKYYLQGKLTESQARSQYSVWCINKGTSTEKGLRDRRKTELEMFFKGVKPVVLPGTKDSKYKVPATLIAQKKISTYDASAQIESSRYIAKGDSCYIQEVYTNGFVKVQYPVSGGKRWSYAKRSDFPNIPIVDPNTKILPGTKDNSYNVPINIKATKKISTYDEYGKVESNRYIAKGDNCYIQEVYTNGYAKVQYPTSSGKRWSYAKASDFPVPKKTDYKYYYVKTNGSNLNLRSEPNTSASVIAIMQNGSKIKVYSISNGWAKAEYNGKTGYCSSQYITDKQPVNYFKKYTGSSTSIVTALKSIGEESSLAYRKKIAAANNISGYTGTASQNTNMLNKLKSGTLIKP